MPNTFNTISGMTVGQHISFIWVILAILFFHTCDEVKGHGHLWSPPQRSSMWRVGFSVPENYNDVGLNCGGFDTQWRENHGRCGPCGDPYQGPHLNDYGGKFDTGTIGATYKAGERIAVKIHLTAFHFGYFVFHLCEKGDLYGDPLQDCLDRTILPVVKNNQLKERYYPQKGKGVYTLKVQLPPEVSCQHCVLQWVYRVGNSWGSDKEGSGLGHGPQEHFINCADIKIRPSKKGHTHGHAPIHVDWYRRFLTDYNNAPVTLAPTTTCATTTTTAKPKEMEDVHPLIPSIAKWISLNNRHHHQTINPRPRVEDNDQVVLAYDAILNNGLINPHLRHKFRQSPGRTLEFNPIVNDHYHIQQPYKMLHQYRNIVPGSTPKPWKLQTTGIQEAPPNQRSNQQRHHNHAIKHQPMLQPRQYQVVLPRGAPFSSPLRPIWNNHHNQPLTQRYPERLNRYINHQQHIQQPQQYNQDVSNRQGSFIIQPQQFKQPLPYNQVVSNLQRSFIIQQQNKQRQLEPDVTEYQGSKIVQQQHRHPKQPTTEVPRTTPKPRIPQETSNQETIQPATTSVPVTSTSRGSKSTCEATGPWLGQADMSIWCQNNCPQFCPASHCKCG